MQDKAQGSEDNCNTQNMFAGQFFRANLFNLAVLSSKFKLSVLADGLNVQKTCKHHNFRVVNIQTRMLHMNFRTIIIRGQIPFLGFCKNDLQDLKF